MKFSEAVIKGYEMNGGKQCFKGSYMDKNNAMCVMGAYFLTINNGDVSTVPYKQKWKAHDTFHRKVGVSPIALNDGGMDWRDIVGIAIAEGM